MFEGHSRPLKIPLQANNPLSPPPNLTFLSVKFNTRFLTYSIYPYILQLFYILYDMNQNTFDFDTQLKVLLVTY